MSKKMFFAAALATMFLSSLSAQSSAEYPYSGYFTSDKSSIDTKDLPLMCALHFFVQHDNGTAEEYVLNVEKFRAEKKIEYLRPYVTNCIFVEAHKTEFCTSDFSTGEETRKEQIYNYILRLTPDSVRSVMFTNSQDYNKFYLLKDRDAQEGEIPGGDPFFYARCPTYSDSTLAPYVSSQNTLSTDDTYKMLSVSPGNLEEMRSVASEVSKILSPTY